MIYLLLSVATGTWLAVVFKIIARKRVRADVVITINYMAGTFSAALQCLGSRQVIRRQGGAKATGYPFYWQGRFLAFLCARIYAVPSKARKKTGWEARPFLTESDSFPVCSRRRFYGGRRWARFNAQGLCLC